MRQRIETDHYGHLERTVLNPLAGSSKSYYVFILVLLSIVGWGIYAYIIQLRYGLLATGMRDVVVWGIYLVNFVFFIGISHAGTLISAILRVTGAGWRTPITRMAELITVVAISIGALMPIIDVGRPERLWHMIVFGRFQSAIMWDIMAIICYLTGSLIYLYLPLIPDFALMRDRLGRGVQTFKYKMYSYLAVGWRNTQEQRYRLERAIRIMAILIIPIAISVHTVVAFIFSMNLRPGWDSTIFGIYFVIGAIFSGIATILIAMAIFRRIFNLEEYINVKHFRYLSYLLITMLLLYLYLTVSEYLTAGYKLEIEEKHLLDILIFGENAPWFWLFVFIGMIVPAILIVFKRLPTIPRIVTAAILVNIGMWFKRFVIIIPTLQVPLMPFEFGVYNPTWIEWSITAGAFAAFILVFAIVVKFIPIISIWEVAKEIENQPVEPQVTARNRL